MVSVSTYHLHKSEAIKEMQVLTFLAEKMKNKKDIYLPVVSFWLNFPYLFACVKKKNSLPQLQLLSQISSKPVPGSVRGI